MLLCVSESVHAHNTRWHSAKLWQIIQWLGELSYSCGYFVYECIQVCMSVTYTEQAENKDLQQQCACRQIIKWFLFYESTFILFKSNVAKGKKTKTFKRSWCFTVFCHSFYLSHLEKNGLPNSSNSFLLPQQALQKQYTIYNLQINCLSEESIPPPPSGIINCSNVSSITFKMNTINCTYPTKRKKKKIQNNKKFENNKPNFKGI